MTDDKKKRYAKVIISMSVDYLQDKITWGHYLATVQAALDKIKEES